MHLPLEHAFGSSLHSSISTQALLSDDARNPTLHVQTWPPIVLVHLFPIPQMADTSVHSFTSKKENHVHFVKPTVKSKLLHKNKLQMGA